MGTIIRLAIAALIGFIVGVFATGTFFTYENHKDNLIYIESNKASMSIDFGSNVSMLSELDKGNFSKVKKFKLTLICQSLAQYKEHLKKNDYPPQRQAEAEHTLAMANTLIDKYRNEFGLINCE